MVKKKEKTEQPRKEKNKSGFGNWLNNFFLRVSNQEQLIFVKNLSVMVKAGLPLSESLKMIQQETKSRSLKKILLEVIDEVNNGQALSAALEKYRNIFGDLSINMIQVGESSGILSENLNYLAEELKKKSELKKKVVGALVYPIIVLVATFGITGLLTIGIFPKILPIFKTLKVKLPLSTRILIAVSNFLTERGTLAGLILLGIVVTVWILLRFRKIHYFSHIIILRLPIFGKMARAANLSNFTRTLGLTLKSGVKIVEAVSITAKSLSNLVYQKQLTNIAEQITKGQTISEYLYPHKHLFPQMLAQMVAVGENTGNLSEALLYLSEFYESELSDLTKNLSNVLEPVLMVVMGVMVGFVAISIITPIYEVTSSFNH